MSINIPTIYRSVNDQKSFPPISIPREVLQRSYKYVFDMYDCGYGTDKWFFETSIDCPIFYKENDLINKLHRVTHCILSKFIYYNVLEMVIDRNLIAKESHVSIRTGSRVFKFLLEQKLIMVSPDNPSSIIIDFDAMYSLYGARIFTTYPFPNEMVRKFITTFLLPNESVDEVSHV